MDRSPVLGVALELLSVAGRSIVAAHARGTAPFLDDQRPRRGSLDYRLREQWEAEGEILGEDLRLDAPPIFALGGI